MSKFAPHRPSNNRPKASSTTICQKCLGTGHYIFECKSTRPYVSRPSRTEMLENPKLLAKLKDGKPSVEVPEEFRRKSGTANRILEAKESEQKALEASKGKAKEEDEGTRKKARRSSSSSSSSDNSESDSDSGSSSSGSSDSSGSTSDSSATRSVSRERSRKRLRRHRSSSIISESSTRSRESRPRR